MKRMLLSYDIIDDKHNEQDIWDELYNIQGLNIVDKPVLSTLLLESEDISMWIKITQMLNAKFKHVRFAICQIESIKTEDNKEQEMYLDIPHSESQRQIEEYLEGKKKVHILPRKTK